jgi:hypothetical protein
MSSSAQGNNIHSVVMQLPYLVITSWACTMYENVYNVLYSVYSRSTVV